MKAAEISLATCECISPATRFGQTGNGLWVLDGVRPSNPAYLLDERGDEIWYVDHFDDYLKSAVSESTQLPEVIKDGILHISDVFANALGETTLDVSFFPAASIALLRFDTEAGTVDYFTLGDAGLVVEYGDEIYRICANDSGARQHKNENEDPGWLLSFAHDVVPLARQGTLPLEEVSAVYLFTGEFEDCRLDLDPVYSWDRLLEWLTVDGVGTVLRHVEECRAIQMEEHPQRLALSSVLFPQSQPS